MLCNIFDAGLRRIGPRWILRFELIAREAQQQPSDARHTARGALAEIRLWSGEEALHHHDRWAGQETAPALQLRTRQTIKVRLTQIRWRNEIISNVWFIFVRCSPYAYNFGLGKRADTEDAPNYDEDSEFFADPNNYDKASVNMENWEDGALMDNKNDIDVIDYDLIGYPSGKHEVRYNCS